MDLTDVVPSLKRAVAPLGEFDTYFPNTTDDDVRDLLADAVAECQLDGFLSSHVLDVETAEVLPDMSNAQIALVVLYGMARVLQARLGNTKNRTKYVAGSAEAETEQSASILVELLRQTKERKRQLLDDARSGNASSAFVMVDGYIAKSIDLSMPDVDYIYQIGY